MNTQAMKKTLANYFKTQPVLKAWLFGSFARGEETPDSDVDILVVLRSWRRNTRQRCGHSRRARSLSARRLKVLWYVRRPEGTLEP